MTTLTDLFLQSKGGPIVHNGRTVQINYSRTLKALPVGLVVKRQSEKGNVEQGLVISLNKGKMLCNGITAKNLELWNYNSPATVEIEIRCKVPVIVSFCNVWRWHGMVVAGAGNAGMIVEEFDSSVKLNCSNGVGEIDFCDYVVELSFQPMPGSGERQTRQARSACAE